MDICIASCSLFFFPFFFLFFFSILLPVPHRCNFRKPGLSDKVAQLERGPVCNLLSKTAMKLFFTDERKPGKLETSSFFVRVRLDKILRKREIFIFIKCYIYLND